MVASVDNQTQTKVSERLIEQLRQQSHENFDVEDLRVQVGRSVVLGRMASGEYREHISAEQADEIATAIQQPVTEGADVEAYARKLPNIEIKSGETIVFRQERDGVISANVFQAEQQSQSEALSSNPVTAPSEPSAPELEGDALMESAVRAESLVASVREISNPLDHEVSEPVATRLGEYMLQVESDSATVLKEDAVVLAAKDGAIISNLSEPDTQALQGWLQRGDGIFEPWAVPIQQPASQVSEPPPAIAIAQEQIAALPEGRGKQFFQRLSADLKQQANEVFSAIRQGLESEQLGVLRQKVGTVMQEAPEKATVALGRGLETAGQWITSSPDAIKNAMDSLQSAAEQTGGGIEKSGQWLAARPEAIREHRAMQTAMKLFEAGFRRTHEKSFEVGGFKVEFEGGQQLRLSDAQSDETLMRFQQTASPFPGHLPRLEVIEKGDISREQYQSLNAVGQRGEPVRGSQDAETLHARKSEQIAQLSKGLAEAMGSTDYRGKHYRIELGEDTLRISANDGRGELYHREGNQVVSNQFEQKDFGRFAQVIQKLEQQQATHTPNTQVELD